jgi:hypothetical protein
MKTNDGRLIVIAGRSRSGKTAYTLRQVRHEPRVLVWDIEDQWSAVRGFRKLTSRIDLLRAAKTPGPGKWAYVASGDIKDEFDYWAECVFSAGKNVGPIVAVAEELADVTSPSKAGGNWGVLLRRGLKRGVTIYAISQRWAEADKTAVGNASEFVLFSMSSGDDIAYMSRKTRIPVWALEELRPLDYVRYTVMGELEKGRLKF